MILQERLHDLEKELTVEVKEEHYKEQRVQADKDTAELEQKFFKLAYIVFLLTRSWNRRSQAATGPEAPHA